MSRRPAALGPRLEIGTSLRVIDTALPEGPFVGKVRAGHQELDACSMGFATGLER